MTLILNVREEGTMVIVGTVPFYGPKNVWEKSEKEWGTRRNVVRPVQTCLCVSGLL